MKGSGYRPVYVFIVRTLFNKTNAESCGQKLMETVYLYRLRLSRRVHCTLKKGDSHLKHSILISTIPWLHFLAPTQCRITFTYLLLAPTWGLCLPQPVSVLGYAFSPSPGSFRLAQAIVEPNLFLYKYHNNLIPVILPTYTAYEDGTECSETSAHKIQTSGNHPKERIQYV